MKYKCEMCDNRLSNKYVPEADRWDWFMGWLDHIHHYCPLHAKSKERDEMFRLSRIKPGEPTE